MKNHNKSILYDYKLDLLPAILVAISLFFYLTGGKILNVRYYQWLDNKDPAQFFLGWLFFKNSEFWQNIVGFNPDFAYEIVNSIVYTDSIPLLAIFLKIFSNFLPPDFQYFGWWILFCFILQALFSMILLKKITSDFRVQFLGSLFFIFAPVLLFRIFYCHHFSLGAHFLILAALILYLRKDFSQALWILLILVSLGVHFYIFVMIFFIYLADLAQRILIEKKQLLPALLKAFEYFILAIISIVFAMWQYGYFVVGIQNVPETLFGMAKTNLLAVIDSDALWSKIIPDQAQGQYEYEGFAYLGLGVILMIGLLVFVEIFYHKKLQDFNKKLCEKKFIPLIFVVFILVLLSLTNHISLGEREIFTFEISAIQGAFLAIIRSSGRMFWVAYYLIIFTTIYGIIKLCKKRESLAVLALALLFILQFGDMSFALQKTRNSFFTRYENSNPFVLPYSDFWNNAKNKYKKIILIPVTSDPQQFEAIAFFAAINHLKINAAYVARRDKASEKIFNEIHFQEISRKNFDEEAIYIFNNDILWNLAQKNAREQDFVGEISNYKILAPKFLNNK